MSIIDRRGIVVDGTPSSAASDTPSAGITVKTPCRVATTASITLSGLQSIDGVTVASDDRVLVKNQSSASLNGIYNASSGDWVRSDDFDGPYEVVKGTQVFVNEGSVSAGFVYYVSSSDPLTIGTSNIAFTSAASNGQPLDATLTALAGVTTAANKLIYATGADAFSTADLTAAGRAILDDANAGAQRTTLGLGNLDNTADADKPVSTATQTALNAKAPLASPTFTGTPGAPTPSVGDASTQIATTAFVSAILPASSADNAVARFDSTTGKLLQASALIAADTTGALSRAGGGGVPVQGSNTNSSPAAGDVGEYISSSIASGSAVSLVNATAKDIGTISLTAGNWWVWGNILFAGAGATTITTAIGGINSTANTLPTAPNGGAIASFAAPTGQSFAGNNAPTLPLGGMRVSLSATTTYRLIGYAEFGVSTLGAYGFVGAVRLP